MAISHRRTVIILGVLAGLAGAALLPRGAGADVYGDAENKRYHTETCPEKSGILPRNLVVFGSEAQAAARGYYPCPVCNPPSVGKHSQPGLQRQLSRPVTRNSYFLGDRKNKIYHYVWCPLGQAVPEQDRVRLWDLSEAAKAGYQRCPRCNPPQALGMNQDRAGSGKIVLPRTARGQGQAPEGAEPAAGGNASGVPSPAEESEEESGP